MKFPSKQIIAQFFQAELWTKDMVMDAVKCGAITIDDYKEITGDE
ncbi:MAG TPA: XkdX family protein [Enterococcus sp.]|nr:XkdX family protein [Enterococcus sp.]